MTNIGSPYCRGFEEKRPLYCLMAIFEALAVTHGQQRILKLYAENLLKEVFGSF